MQRTILFGIDGASFTVLDALMAAGHLPHFQAFVNEGVRAELLSTIHPLTPPAWMTLMTGRTPGNHGIYDFLRAEIRQSGAFFTLNDFRNVKCETIWSIVSRQQGRVTSLNFPLMAPPPAVNGVLVPGLLSWRHLRRNIHPPEMFDRIKALPGFDAQQISWDFEHERKGTQVLPDEELEDWNRFHIDREQQWFSILRFLMNEEPADLTAAMLDGVDKLQHSCWRFLDPRFVPAEPTPFESRIRELCIEYFRRLDDFLGELVELAGPDARIFIASDHGFGPTETVLRINKWLEQHGYLQWSEPGAAKSSGEAPKTGNKHYVLLDWNRTRAYAQSGATNGIHILQQSETHPNGVPAGEYEAFRAKLAAELLELRDPQSGRQIVTRVLTREEAYPGTEMGAAPDLTLALFDHSFFSVLNAEPIVERRPSVAGTHNPEGVFLAKGPGIARGQQLDQQSILDIAPTLLYSLGLPVPEDFEGGVIKSAFEPGYLQARPIQSGPPTQLKSAGVEVASDEEEDADSEEKILNRLRALGYVE